MPAALTAGLFLSNSNNLAVEPTTCDVAGGRSKGVRAVYCRLDPATAILEMAFHEGFRALDAVPHVVTRGDMCEPSRIYGGSRYDSGKNWLPPAFQVRANKPLASACWPSNARSSFAACFARMVGASVLTLAALLASSGALSKNPLPWAPCLIPPGAILQAQAGNREKPRAPRKSAAVLEVAQGCACRRWGRARRPRQCGASI
jgi:hypothetical protein